MPAKPNEIQITRVYDAPVKLVWDAWTDLNHVVKWWGPRGFTLTTKSKDFRPGGKWIYTMHGPDGTDYPNIATYHEIVKYEKMVYDHGGNEERQKLFTVTVTFKENKGKTTMCMTMALDTAEEAKAIKQFIKTANGNSTWDRLGEYLENETAKKDVFIINRSFAANIKTVFDMWVNPEHLSKWMGPKGSEMSFIYTNVKEGGSSHWAMSMGGDTNYGLINYKTISPHDLFVYTQNFTDKDGKISKPSFIPNYPSIIMATVAFAEEGPDETRVTLTWEIVGEATDVERRTFHDMKTSMMGGWTGSFDKLEEVLERRK
ncbi:MAG: SRPBCC family protein [Pseudobdellovibrionaceae bacterium]